MILYFKLLCTGAIFAILSGIVADVAEGNKQFAIEKVLRIIFGLSIAIVIVSVILAIWSIP